MNIANIQFAGNMKIVIHKVVGSSVQRYEQQRIHKMVVIYRNVDPLKYYYLKIIISKNS